MPANTIAATRIGNVAPTGGSATQSPTTVITLTAAANVGQRVVVMTCNNLSTNDPAQTVADFRGNSYSTVIDSTFGNSSRRMGVFVCRVTTALQINDTITITHSGQSPNRRTATAIACDNISLLNTILTTSGSGAATTSPNSSITDPRLDANSIIFGVAGNSATVTGSSFSVGTNFTNGETLESGTGVTWRTLGTEWQIVSASGTDAATGTWATAPSSWDMLAVVFQQLDTGDEPTAAAGQWGQPMASRTTRVFTPRVRGDDLVENGHAVNTDPYTDTSEG